MARNPLRDLKPRLRFCDRCGMQLPKSKQCDCEKD